MNTVILIVIVAIVLFILVKGVTWLLENRTDHLIENYLQQLSERDRAKHALRASELLDKLSFNERLTDELKTAIRDWRWEDDDESVTSMDVIRQARRIFRTALKDANVRSGMQMFLASDIRKWLELVELDNEV